MSTWIHPADFDNFIMGLKDVHSRGTTASQTIEGRDHPSDPSKRLRTTVSSVVIGEGPDQEVWLRIDSEKYANPHFVDEVPDQYTSEDTSTEDSDTEETQ